MYGGPAGTPPVRAHALVRADSTAGALRAFFAVNPAPAAVHQLLEAARPARQRGPDLLQRVVAAALAGAGPDAARRTRAVATLLVGDRQSVLQALARHAAVPPCIAPLHQAALADDAPWAFGVPRAAVLLALDDLGDRVDWEADAAVVALGRLVQEARYAWFTAQLADATGALDRRTLARVAGWWTETTPLAWFRLLLPHLPPATATAEPFGAATGLARTLAEHGYATPADWAALLARAATPAARWAVAATVLGLRRPTTGPAHDPATVRAALAAAAAVAAQRPFRMDADGQTAETVLHLTFVCGDHQQWATVLARLAEQRGAWRPFGADPDTEAPDVQTMLTRWWDTHQGQLTPDVVAPLLQSRSAPLRQWVLMHLGDIAPTAAPTPPGHLNARPDARPAPS